MDFNGGMSPRGGCGLKPLMKYLEAEATPQWPSLYCAYPAIVEIHLDVPLFVSLYQVLQDPQDTSYEVRD